MSNRRYARTARLNELLREILGEELERMDDERLELVTISGVEVDPGLEHAVVYFSSLAGEEEDDAVLAAFDEARRGLQSAVARQARIRSTPKLVFRADPGIRTGARVDEILRDLHASGELDDEVDGEVDRAEGAGPGEENGDGEDWTG
jgi:ribosome-binding factor A